MFKNEIDRRAVLLGGAAALGGCATGLSPAADAELAAIRDMLGPGARLGVAALDTGTGRRIGFDADARYAMASTFKAPLAAAVLARADAGALSLDDPVRFGTADLLEYAPVVRAAVCRANLTVRQLCAAAVEVSDNSAANLLLGLIGGPAGFTRFVRAAGDSSTRLDRIEPELNANMPGDLRDTTTPAAMTDLMRALLVGRVLAPSSAVLLRDWMVGSTTGRERLRADLPSDWRVGDKTGTGERGAVNDIAVAWPPGRAPIFISCYQSGGNADRPARNLAHARVAKLVAERLSVGATSSGR